MRFRVGVLSVVVGMVVATGAAGAAPVVGDPTPISFVDGVEFSPPTASSPAIACVADGECVAVGQFHNTNGGYEPATMTMTDGVWGPATPVPFTDGVQSSPEDSILWDVSCPALGECAAVGNYKQSGGATRVGFTLRMTGGSWGPVTVIQFAPGIENPTPNTFVDRVTCPAVGECVAGGRFFTAGHGYEAFTVRMTGGVWGQASPIDIGSPRATVRNEALRALSCPAVGECVAVGSFTSADDGYEVFTASMTGGVWDPGTALPFAPGVQAPRATSLAETVSCPQVGSCVTAGSFVDSDNHTVAFIATMVGGVWGTPEAVSFAPGLQSPTPEARIDAVACGDVGDCVAAGSFTDAGDVWTLFVVRRVGGVWGQAELLDVSALPQSSEPEIGVTGLACAGRGACFVAGYFNGASRYEAFTVALSAGVWGAAQPVTFPVGLRATTGAGEEWLADVVCVPGGSCVVVGNFPPAGSPGGLQVFSMTVTGLEAVPPAPVGPTYTG